MFRRSTTISKALACMALVYAVAGCARTRQTRSVEPSGFLTDHSRKYRDFLFREGTGDEPRLVYVNSAANFSKYDKLIIESVTMWADESRDLDKLPKETQKALTDAFYNAMHTELSKDYQIVTKDGPGTMRARVAITESRGAKVALNVITTVLPQLRLLTSLGGLATDTAIIVGAVSFEGMLTDAMTGEILTAAVDRRVGTKTLRGAFSKWGDVEVAFTTWAENFRKNLAKLRDGKPKS